MCDLFALILFVCLFALIYLDRRVDAVIWMKELDRELYNIHLVQKHMMKSCCCVSFLCVLIICACVWVYIYFLICLCGLIVVCHCVKLGVH